MKQLSKLFYSSLALTLLIGACSEDVATEPDDSECSSSITLDTSRGACTETLEFTPLVSVNVSVDFRTITANNIPDHDVGLFGNVQGSLNPNAISQQNSTYEIDATPRLAGTNTQLLGDSKNKYTRICSDIRSQLTWLKAVQICELYKSCLVMQIFRQRKYIPTWTANI